MKVLITFLFLGSCVFEFGLGSSEAQIEMVNKTTYQLTCLSSPATIKCCSIEMKQGKSYVQKKSWKGRQPSLCGGGNPSDIFAGMVTDYNTVNSACIVNLTSNTDERKIMSKFRSMGLTFLRLITFFLRLANSYSI